MTRPSPRPWRVLHVITRLERGGSSDCTLWQAVGAARRGHAVTIASGPTDAPSPLLAAARRQAGLTFVTVPGLMRPIRPLADLRAMAHLFGLIRRGGFDVVHLHTSKAGALGRIAAWLAGRSRRVVHQPHGHLFYGYYGPAGSRCVVTIERALAPLARLHVTLTDAGAGEHLARRIGRREQFRTLPSGIDFRDLRAASRNRNTLRAAHGYGPGETVVGSLCRLEPIKGVAEVVEGFLVAATARPALRLLVGGDGPLRERLERMIRTSGAGERVRLAGGWTSPAALLPACDIFVLASRNEGMGRALVEAMALGIPVVASAVGGIPDLLDGGRAGLLVPPGDPEAIAGALARLADDPALARAIGRAGKARSVSFGAGRMAHRLMRIYGEVAA